MSSKPPVFINEDLPASIRRDQALLRKKRKEAIDEGKKFTIDWNNKRISVENTTFTVINGKISETASTSDSKPKSNALPTKNQSSSDNRYASTSNTSDSESKTKKNTTQNHG
jgi:hypothetical protein